MEILVHFRNNCRWGEIGENEVQYGKTEEQLEREIQQRIEETSSFSSMTVIQQLRLTSETADLFGTSGWLSGLEQQDTFWTGLLESAKKEFESIANPWKYELFNEMDNALLTLKKSKDVIRSSLGNESHWIKRQFDEDMIFPFSTEEEFKELQVCRQFVIISENLCLLHMHRVHKNAHTNILFPGLKS